MHTKKTDTAAARYLSPTVKKILFRSGGFLLLFLFLFSICLICAANMLSSNLSRKQIDEDTILLEYLTAALPMNADNLFCEYIDTPMEDFFNSSTLTNFYFSTEKYPAEENLTSYLESSLTDFVDSSKYISGAVVYASTTNTYIANKHFEVNQKVNEKGFLDDMIYKYNSSTLEKAHIAGRKSNTFIFRFKDLTILSKDVTTLAGTPHAVMFVFLDIDQLASSIYEFISSVPYRLSIYDTYNHFLFSNSSEDQNTTDSYISRLSTKEIPVEQNGDRNFVYCRSNILCFQYMLEINKDALSHVQTNPVLFYGITAFIVLLFSLLMLLFCFALFGKPAAKLIFFLSAADTNNSSLPAHTFRFLGERIEGMFHENLGLRKIVAATSSEAVSHLFSRLIAGLQVEEEELRITLDNTDFGFRLSDIYIAGILYHAGQNFLSAESRYRILNLLNSTFKEFQEKNTVNICAFIYDEKSIAIIASFVSGTSIANGKSKIDTLKEQIHEMIAYSKIRLLIAFGNMYGSILDLSFSYNEAFRGIHYMVEAISASNPTANPVLETDQADPDPCPDTLSDDSADAEASDHETSSQNDLDLIYRRAEQLAKVIWDEKEDQLQSLIERTAEDIFQIGSLSEQVSNCKRLVSAVTSCMLSYPFVSDTHLSDVYNQLSLRLEEQDLSSAGLKREVEDALLILCNDFSEALKKQRNPYIMAAQEYIRQHYGSSELTLEEIAERLKIAPNYLSTIFSRNLGIRLFEYINEYRLEKSIDLLLNTAKSINDISEESGFGSSRNYIRIFKKYKGLPPGAYRKQHQEQKASEQPEKGSKDENS